MPMIELVIRHALWPLLVLYIVSVYKEEIRKKLELATEATIAGNNVRFQQNDTTINDDIPDSVKEPIATKDKNNQPTSILEQENEALKTALFMERLYHVIFSSQIFLLEKLRASGSFGLTLTTIQAYFSNVQNERKILSFSTFEEYISFLENVHLIKKQNNDRYAIGERGKRFLDYIEERNYNKAKDDF